MKDSSLIFRQAKPCDIKQIMKVRFSVKENVLADPTSVTDQMCLDYLEKLGRGWVCLVGTTIVGFSYVATKDNSIWALFVDPDYEGRGIGRELLDLAVRWLFSKGAHQIVLETEAETRADKFYSSQHWIRGSINVKGDVTYVLTKSQFVSRY